jgi:hypothetical protein
MSSEEKKLDGGHPIRQPALVITDSACYLSHTAQALAKLSYLRNARRHCGTHGEGADPRPSWQPAIEEDRRLERWTKKG